MDGLLDVLGQPEEVIGVAHTDPLVMDEGRGPGDAGDLGQDVGAGKDGGQERAAGLIKEGALPPGKLLPLPEVSDGRA